MRYAVEISLGAMRHILSTIMTGSCIQKLRAEDSKIHRQREDRISQL
jgi:hypothetical protein